LDLRRIRKGREAANMLMKEDTARVTDEQDCPRKHPGPHSFKEKTRNGIGAIHNGWLGEKL